MYSEGWIMIENLLCIAKDLLHSLEKFDFKEKEKDYITGVARKVIDLILLEMEKEI